MYAAHTFQNTKSGREALKACIEKYINELNKPENRAKMSDTCRKSFIDRLQLCRKAKGGNFSHVPKKLFE